MRPDEAAGRDSERGRLAELARLFLRLGFTAFGGPAAHVAMMRDEVVRRRGWLDDAAFLDLVGAANLIPGPNSTELAIHIGHARAGWRGLLVAGACFISPAVAIVLACAWAYVRYGGTPTAGALLYGVKPVIIAIVAQALWGLGRIAVRGVVGAAVGLAVLTLYVAGVHELLLLLGGGLALLLWSQARRLGRVAPAALIGPLLAPPASVVVAGVAGYSAAGMFLTFLKIGSVLYGSGYVLLAFVRADFVERLGWLTDNQLIDAVAVGQFTPGPVFTTATFIGYVAGGWGGAAAATLGIFLPAFCFVALSIPLLARLRRSAPFRALLDGVNVASLGLMAAVSWQLARASIVDWLTAALAVGALAVLLRWRLNSAWLVLAGAAVGLIAHLAISGA